MKKCFLVLLSCLFIFSIDEALAITKDELTKEIKDGYTINDSLFKLSEEDFKKVEGYLNNNNITEENLDFLMRKIDEIVLIIDRGNSTNLYELSEEEIDEINLIIDEMIEKTGIEVANRHGLTAKTEESNNSGSIMAIVLVGFVLVAGLIAFIKVSFK